MRIVLPVHHFPPRYSSGAELYTFRLAKRLRSLGHDVQVVCLEAIDEGSPDRLSVVNNAYEGIPVWRLGFDIFHSPQRRLWDYDNALLATWFADFLAEHKPDLVHFQAGYLIGIAPVNAAVDAGIPTVLTLHDFWYLCPRHTLQRGDGTLCAQIPEDPAACAWCRKLEEPRYRLLDRLSLNLAGWLAQQTTLQEDSARIADRRQRLHAALAKVDAVIAPSRFMAAQFAPHVRAERLHVLRYGLDPVHATQATPPRTDDTFHVGFTGQIAPHKGVHLLVQAFRTLDPKGRPLALHIHGGLEAYPHYVAHLRRLIGDDKRIHLHGRFASAQLADVLNALDVVVVPSNWYENSPLAIMEAHAAGKPVITAALGGMAELVNDGVDGLHFRADDAADLARQLQRLLDEPALLSSLTKGIVAPRNLEFESQALLEIYHSILQPQLERAGGA